MPSAELKIQTKNLSESSSDVIIAFVSSKEVDKKPEVVWPGSVKELDAKLSGQVIDVAKEEGFDGSAGKTLKIRVTGSPLQTKRLVIVGLGDIEKLNAQKLLVHSGKGVEAALVLKDVKSVSFVFPDFLKIDSFATLQALIDSAIAATYKSLEAKEKEQTLQSIDILEGKGIEQTDLDRAHAFAYAKSYAKDFVNIPANIKTTSTLANAAMDLGKTHKLEVKVEDNVEWIKKNMPCFYAVAQGSLATDPPKFIRLHYKPTSAKKKIAVVGKSVIFDTGGYQVKPDEYMNTMKADMTGGATALAVIRAVAELKLNVEVIAFLAATPNKIDSDAMVPDSIVDTTSGKKVEIRHTDAEGRLTLIDAVAMAARENPDLILTIATLTGSAARAVGDAIALMGNDKDSISSMEESAKFIGDKVQVLEVWEDDYEDIKSKLDGADIINTSHNKNRGAQSAAAFVMSGLPEGKSLVHFDVAGGDMTKDEKATGIAVKTILQYLTKQ